MFLSSMEQSKRVMPSSNPDVARSRCCNSNIAYSNASIGLDRVLSVMPRSQPGGAFDAHLLLYPLNVLRLTEAVLQTVQLLPDDENSACLDTNDMWTRQFTISCSLKQIDDGDYQVRMNWRIRVTDDLNNCLLSRRQMIYQWAIAIKHLQLGQSCSLLGLHQTTGAGIRFSASVAVNELINKLPDLLEDICDCPDKSFAYPVSSLCLRIKATLSGVFCAPLYEELNEFVLSSDDIQQVLPQYSDKMGG